MLSLEEFITPLPVEELVGAFWSDRLYARPDGPRPAALLDAAPELASAEEVLRGYDQPVRVSRKGGPYGSAPTGADAVQAYRAGFTCVLLNMERSFPGLKDLIADAAGLFGLPPSALSCESFCSSASSGLAMHSDFDVNFALLLHGRKKWRLAPNRSIVNQTSLCFAGGSVQPDPKQVKYAHAPFPDQMPADCVDVDVEPGGFLFIPRGWWHETYSTGDCLQLNLTIKGPHWAGVYSRALESVLLEDAEWRKYAYGIASAGAPREKAIDELAVLLDRLRRDQGLADPRELAAKMLDLVDVDKVESGSQRKASRLSQTGPQNSVV
ncbi:cupin-like domain-containing protein [Amycolatopsis sp. NPDC026612]|uniref:cupin-like domain-containing protein n=1 Tax=Amycolatopsis sp. NPDC026612 TaxID=3155466 RepID=UPI0033DD25E1